MATEYFFKRNFFHPKLKFAGEEVPWERVGLTSGSLATEDSKLIAFLKGIAEQYPGSVRVLKKDEYEDLKKKPLLTGTQSAMAPRARARIDPKYQRRGEQSTESSARPGGAAGAAGSKHPGAVKQAPPAKIPLKTEKSTRRTTAIEAPATIEPPPPAEETKDAPADSEENIP